MLSFVEYQQMIYRTIDTIHKSAKTYDQAVKMLRDAGYSPSELDEEALDYFNEPYEDDEEC